MENTEFIDIAECYHHMNDRIDSSFLEFNEIQSLLLGEEFVHTIMDRIDVSKCKSVSRKGLYYQFVV